MKRGNGQEMEGLELRKYEMKSHNVRVFSLESVKFFPGLKEKDEKVGGGGRNARTLRSE